MYLTPKLCSYAGSFSLFTTNLMFKISQISLWEVSVDAPRCQEKEQFHILLSSQMRMQTSFRSKENATLEQKFALVSGI